MPLKYSLPIRNGKDEPPWINAVTENIQFLAREIDKEIPLEQTIDFEEDRTISLSIVASMKPVTNKELYIRLEATADDYTWLRAQYESVAKALQPLKGQGRTEIETSDEILRIVENCGRGLTEFDTPTRITTKKPGDSNYGFTISSNGYGNHLLAKRNVKKIAETVVGSYKARTEKKSKVEEVDKFIRKMMRDAPDCDSCGFKTVRNGACYKCLNCGASMGCS